MASDILAEIAAILNKAENTDNEHEREAFLHAAYVKSTRHGIDLAVARAHTQAGQQREEPTHQQITLGYARQQGLAQYVRLFSGIAGAHDVTINIAHNSTHVIAFGMPSDIEKVEALYLGLVAQMVTEASAYIKSGDYKSEVVRTPVRRRDYYGETYNEWVSKPVDGRVARRSFMEAYTSKVSQRLRAARNEAQAAQEQEQAAQEAQSPAQQPQQATSTALVLASKREEVKDYYKAHSTARGSWKGGSSSAGSSSQARRAGTSAGARAALGTSRAIA